MRCFRWPANGVSFSFSVSVSALLGLAVIGAIVLVDADWKPLSRLRRQAQSREDNEELVETSSYETLKIWLAEELLKNKLEAVSLVDGVRDTKVVELNRTYLWCRFSGSPAPKITWSKDGRPLRRSGRLQVHDTVGASAVLIQRASLSDAGNYTCSAQQGGLSPINSTATLRVVLPQTQAEYPLVTVREPERRTYEITSVVQIECNVAVPPGAGANVQPSVFWFRNQTPIVTTDSRYSVGGSTTDDHTLRIRNAIENDTGDYECVAWMPADGQLVVSTPTTVFVKARQVAPRITNISANCEVRSGSSLQVFCMAIGFPMPSVRWEERGRTISSTLPDVARSTGYSSAALVNLRNTKNLTCVANSSLGLVQQSVTIVVVEEPLAPTSLETVAVDSTSIRIRWAPASRPAAVGVQPARWRFYIVRYRRKLSPPVAFTEIENLTSTDFTASSLTPFTEYEFQLLSRNDMGLSLPSPILTAATLEAPPADAPSTVYARAFNRSSLEITWRPPSSPNGVITGYVVSYVRVNDSAPSYIPPIGDWQRVEVRNAINRVVLGRLVANQTYRFVLNAQNKAGDGPASEPVLIITDPNVQPVPQAPRRLFGRALGYSSVSLVWDLPANNWVNISAYEIFYNDSETGGRVQSAALHKVLDGLYPSTTYAFFVTALNSNGRSPPSNVITLRTEEYAPAASPSSLQVVHVGERFAYLQWNPVAKRDSNGAISGYRLLYCAELSRLAVGRPARNCANVTIMSPSQLTYNLTELAPWTVYRVWIFALNHRGESPLNRSASVTLTTAESVPGRPTEVSGMALNSTAIRIIWHSPSEGERNGVIGSYTILYWEKADQGSIWTASISALESNRSAPRNRYEHVIGGLRPATDYEIVVKAITRRGDGERSIAITRRTLAATPESPRDFVVRAAGDPLIVSASWAPPVNTHGNLTRYRLSYVRRERSSGLLNVPNSEVILDLVPEQQAHWLPAASFLFGATYEFSLRAANANGESNAVVTRVTMPERRPAASPANLSACALNESTAELRWDSPPVRDQNGVIVLYETMYARIGGPADDSEALNNEINVNTTERRLVLHGLKAGSEYRFNVRAFNGAGGSDWSDSRILQFIGIRPQPPRSIFVNRSSSQPRTLEIRFSFPAQSVAIEKFRLYFTTDDSLPFPSYWHVREQHPATIFEVSGVDPNAVYSVRLTSVGSDCLESPYSEVAREALSFGVQPADRLGQLRALFINSSSVHLSWPLTICAGALNESNTFFTVRYFLKAKLGSTAPIHAALRLEKERNESSNSAILTGLEAFASYDVTVFAPRQPCSVQQPLRRIIDTDVAAPPMPAAPELGELVPPNAFLFRIKPASNENGIVTRYWMIVVPQRDGAFEPTEEACSRDLKSLQVNTMSLDIFKPFLAASFNASRWPSTGIVEIGGGQRSDLNDQPVSVVQLQQTLVYRVLIKAMVDANRFSCSPYSVPFAIGAVFSAAVESPRSASTTRLDDLILIVSPICAFIALLLIAVVVAVLLLSRRKNSQRRYADGVPKNGSAVYLPLQVNTAKRSELNSLTQPLLAAQTGSPTQPPVSQTVLSSSPNGHGYNNGSSNSSATGLTMSASNTLRNGTAGNPLLQQAAIFAASQRGAHSPPRDSERSFTSPVDMPDAVETRRLNMPTTALMAHPPVALDAFVDHVERLKANENLKFSQEYESIDPGQQFTWEHSNADVNKSKNRYANVVAYDHSRVTLQHGVAEDGSDYINANFIDGYRKPNAYIATQGPLSETVTDFWCMIWQQRSTVIVMMTKLEERTRVKCHQYWPCKGAETYGGRVHVTLLDVQEFAYYVIRTFVVQQVGSEEKHEVRQLQFTAWPDHGVPDHPTPLLMFIRRVRSYYTADMGPVIVHCSAGVGRTGAFIVIDVSLERIRHERTLDIYGLVTCLRAQRNYMVQTEDQFIFIHDAMLEALDWTLFITEVAARSLFSHIQKLRQPVVLAASYDSTTASASSNGAVTTTGMEAEFRRLSMFKPHPSRFVSASATANRFKNRLVNILPYENSRVPLQPIRGVEGSDYINASYIDSYRRQRGYIATQGPLAETVDDFWRMLWETGSSIVVMLTKLREVGREKCHQYWPADRSTRYQYFVVDPTAEYSMPQYVLREFKMTDARDGSSRTIRQFQYVEWPEQGVPKSGEGFIDFIGQVHKTKEQFGQDGPITVHCSAGVGRTGVFIALSIILERLRYEGVVDVFQIVRMLRTQRPAMVQTEEQYQFCYTAALEYLGSFDHYAT